MREFGREVEAFQLAVPRFDPLWLSGRCEVKNPKVVTLPVSARWLVVYPF